MVDFPKIRHATWSDVDGWIDLLSRMIHEADRVPQTIVALTRGGWGPARLLADRFETRRLISLRTQHWGITATPSGRAELTEGLSSGVTDEDVLVVDDITDTGESLALAAEHVLGMGPRRLESATCLHITHSKFVPTYYAESIDRDSWVWVVFPWTYWEDLHTLAGRAFDEAHDVQGAAEILRDRCGFSVPLPDIHRVLQGRVPNA
jgi:hypoxanthine phosphoribosyltransferase